MRLTSIDSADSKRKSRPSQVGFFAPANSDDGGVSDDDVFSTDSGGDSTPLGDAQAFDYTPDAESDDATEIAGRGVRMAGNEPGGYRINPNGQDVDYFDSDGNLSAQYHGSHGDPHGHNFNNFD